MKFEPIILPGIDQKRPLLISGPCSAETEDQVLATARQLAAAGVKIFRAGVWKPRTKPGSFEGVGSPALEWLKRVKTETGMYVITEVATEKHLHEAMKQGVDLLWIGARTTVNPFAVQELADALKGVDIPVFVKNPMSPDIELWVGAIERLYNAGIRRIGLIHRGFSSSEKAVYRNPPQWHIPIEMKRRFPSLPMLCDPSHMGGRRDMIRKLSQQAMDLNYVGLMIETHCCPDEAWSDKQQQITPEALKEVLKSLVIRDTVQTTEDLSVLRGQIDDVDYELLRLFSKRMRISREIGHYKLEHGMSILQTQRYEVVHDSLLAVVDSLFMRSPSRTVIPEGSREVYKKSGGVIHLNGSYTVFGEVVEGLETIDKIAALPVDAHDRPVSDVKIVRVYIE